MTRQCTIVRSAVHAVMISGFLWQIAGLVSAAELFVAPDGDDTQLGTPDDPFATIHRAQEAVRAARKARSDEGVTVTVRGGQYQLQRPLVFSAADSGALLDAPVRYRAADGEEVVLSGGRTITSWQPAVDRPGVWKTRVADPDQQEGSAWRFEQLWVNQQRAVRARTPNDWQFRRLAADVLEEDLADQPGRFQHVFSAGPKQLAPLADLREAELRDVQVLVFHKWDTTREWLQTISPLEGIFTTFGSRMKHWNRMTRDCLFFFENFLAALDCAGRVVSRPGRLALLLPQGGRGHGHGGGRRAATGAIHSSCMEMKRIPDSGSRTCDSRA